MATLFFNPQETAILQLFHQDGETRLYTRVRTRIHSLALSENDDLPLVTQVQSLKSLRSSFH